jgi:hypothetical protein
VLCNVILFEDCQDVALKTQPEASGREPVCGQWLSAHLKSTLAPEPAHSARFTEAEHHIEKQQNETAENN